MILGQEVKPPLDENTLAHFGVKGMKWGVHKNRTSAEQTRHDRNVKVAKVAGAVVGTAVLAAGAYYVSKHYGVSASTATKATSVANTGKKFAEQHAQEPVGIVHSSRGVNKGYTFLHKGGLNDPEMQFIKAGFGDGQSPGFFTRFGSKGEKAAATFADPLGRKDAAGRGIVHDIILPAHMSHGVNSAQDVQNLVWPHIKDTYHTFYEASKVKR